LRREVLTAFWCLFVRWLSPRTGLSIVAMAYGSRSAATLFSVLAGVPLSVRPECSTACLAWQLAAAGPSCELWCASVPGGPIRCPLPGRLAGEVVQTARRLTGAGAFLNLLSRFATRGGLDRQGPGLAFTGSSAFGFSGAGIGRFCRLCLDGIMGHAYSFVRWRGFGAFLVDSLLMVRP